MRVWLVAGRGHVADARHRRRADGERGGGCRGEGRAGAPRPRGAKDGGGGLLAEGEGGVLMRERGGGVMRGGVRVGAGVVGQG